MSTTIAAQMPVVAFCYGNTEQLDCLARLGLHTIGDMWQDLQSCTPPVSDSDLSRHWLLHPSVQRHFFDFDKLYRERGVVLGGAWPNQ